MSKIIRLSSSTDQQTIDQVEGNGFELIQIYPDSSGWLGLFKRLQYPSWNGLYEGLLVSQSYRFVLEKASFISSVEGIPSIPVALNTVTSAIQYGISGAANNEVSIPAFQSALDIMLNALSANQVPFTDVHKAELNILFKSFGFTSITLLS